MKPIVFLGPSLQREMAVQMLDAEYWPPCRRGDMDHIVAGRLVGIIDGVFHQAEAVSPKEIVGALSRGVRIWGASSMGALRAAEVRQMRGVGRVYEMYTSGLIDSDDEVALTFDPITYRPLTVPLVTIRCAVERLRAADTISATLGGAIVAAAGALHYTQRTYRNVLRDVGTFGWDEIEELASLLGCHDVKRDDARLLLERLALSSSTSEGFETTCVTQGRQPDNMSARPTDGATNWESDPRADVYIWESGDSVPFGALVAFLKFTGLFESYAATAIVGPAALTNDPATDADAAAATEALDILSRMWGWRSDEEVNVTLNHLGFERAGVLDEVARQLRYARTIDRAIRESDTLFLRKLRHVLLCEDLALKREALKCASLSKCASAADPGRDDQSFARAEERLCRFQGVDSTAEAFRKLEAFGVTASETTAFVRTLEFAHRRVACHAASKASDAQTTMFDADFGLKPTPKTPGNPRFVTAAQSAYTYALQLKEVLGVTRIGMIDRLTELPGIYISQAARPSGGWSSSYGSGKARTKEGAIAGGVLEEVEKWAQEQYDPAWILASFREMERRGEPVVHPRRLDLPHDSIYSEELEIQWCQCADLIQGGLAWVPLAAVACTPRITKPNIYYTRQGCRAIFSTNGLASGFALAEALLHAVCEYIERHATRLAELRVDNPGLVDRQRWPRRIAPVSLPEPAAAVYAALQQHATEPTVWDITSEIAVPTCLARAQWEGRTAVGYGCHPNNGVAAEMALLEVCQTIASNVAGGREDLSVHARSLGRHERPRPQRGAASVFWRGETATMVSLTDVPGFNADDVYSEFCWVRQQLLAANVSSLLVADLTRPLIAPAQAVRVVIPDLETNNPYHCGLHARIALVADLIGI